MKESFSQIIQSSSPTLVDFYAEWCAPCKALAPVLKEVAGRLNGRARIIKVDIDRNPEVAAHYQIQAVPTLVLFKNGQIIWRGTGLVSAAHLEKIITSHL